MADHKFEFTLSGVHLTEEQKSQIAGEIAMVVTRVVVGNSPGAANAAMWSQVKINGGRMIPQALLREVAGETAK